MASRYGNGVRTSRLPAQALDTGDRAQRRPARCCQSHCRCFPTLSMAGGHTMPGGCRKGQKTSIMALTAWQRGTQRSASASLPMRLQSKRRFAMASALRSVGSPDNRSPRDCVGRFFTVAGISRLGLLPVIQRNVWLRLGSCLDSQARVFVPTGLYSCLLQNICIGATWLYHCHREEG